MYRYIPIIVLAAYLAFVVINLSWPSVGSVTPHQWQFMAPPRFTNAPISTEMAAPISNWQVLRLFNTEQECAETQRWLENYAKQQLSTHSSDVQKARYEAAYKRAQACRCIENDDPILGK